MRFCYQYRTSDNVLHEGVVVALNRESAFATLKAKGLKPSKVWEAPGLANQLFGKGKRWSAIAILFCLLGLFVVLLMKTRQQVSTLSSELEAITSENEKAPRHQIYGDPAIMDDIERGNLNALSSRKGDQILAWFAQPGKLMVPEDVFTRRCTDAIATNLLAVQAEHIKLSQDDSREIKELKQIVNGMRLEMAAYLANGNGTIKSYYRRLVERTTQEMQIYNRTKNELENERSSAIWDEKNEALRRLGIRTIPQPQSL